jgi:hypothetical protein
MSTQKRVGFRRILAYSLAALAIAVGGCGGDSSPPNTVGGGDGTTGGSGGTGEGSAAGGSGGTGVEAETSGTGEGGAEKGGSGGTNGSSPEGPGWTGATGFNCLETIAGLLSCTTHPADQADLFASGCVELGGKVVGECPTTNQSACCEDSAVVDGTVCYYDFIAEDFPVYRELCKAKYLGTWVE